jgi:hypothetical protein
MRTSSKARAILRLPNGTLFFAAFQRCRASQVSRTILLDSMHDRLAIVRVFIRNHIHARASRHCD